MKVVIPVAGRATRMRPFTHSKMKALLPVAGKSVIEHILEPIIKLNPTEVWFVTGGPLKEEFELHITDTYPDLPVKFAEQKEPKGPGDAIFQAKEAFDEPVLICYSDTIFDVDLSVLHSIEHNAIWGMEVEEWQRFGIIKTEGGFMVDIVEKPEEFIGNLANIGMYYIKDGDIFIEELEKEYDLAEDEVYPIDPFNRMIAAGKQFKVLPVKGWYDCGTVEQTLVTNAQLLDLQGKDSVIHPTAQVEDSDIGPHVTIGPHVVIKNSTISNSIIDEHTLIEDSKLKDSIVGRHAIVAGKEGKCFLGDHSQFIRHP